MHLLVHSATFRLGPRIEGELFRRLCRSRDFLAAHLDEPVRLADAAAEAGISPFHYHRVFLRTFGETPHQFVTRLRMERAKRLLARERMPVTDVCFAVGYESLGSFSARFRSLTGSTPSDYQRNEGRIFQLAWPKPVRFIPACFQSFYGATTSS